MYVVHLIDLVCFPQQEYLAACLEHVKCYPQAYSIQEISSLTSVKFVGELSLNFEKQLLAMVLSFLSFFCFMIMDVGYTVGCYIYLYCIFSSG